MINLLIHYNNLCYNVFAIACVAELVDAQHSKCCGFATMRVRFPPQAPNIKIKPLRLIKYSMWGNSHKNNIKC